MPPPRLPPRQEIFVNREGPLARFAQAVAELPDQGARLLVFHGVGGQGKTALLRHIGGLAGREACYNHIRTGWLDLRTKPKSDPDLMPVWIRNAFAGAGVAFPAFDLGLALWWEASQRADAYPNLTNAWLSANKDDLAGIGQEAVQWIGSLVAESVGTLPLGTLLKRGGKWLIDIHRQRYLELARPYLQDLPSEPWQLTARLPWLLAQDLNHHLREHPTERFVLLVDEYEGLFTGAESDSAWRTNRFDKHMREVVTNVDGLLAVFGSRRLLPWKEDPDWQGDVVAGDCPLEGLKDSDAQNWLCQAGVTDPGLRAAMLEGAREEKRVDALVYPLLLDLQVEHWRSLTTKGRPYGPEDFRVEAESFQARCQELTQRLLRGYSEGLEGTLKRLSVANRFDRTAFEHAVRAFGTGLPLDRFETLTDLSFVSAGEDGWLTLHRAVADAIAATLSDAIRHETVEALLAHFKARAAVERSLDLNDTTVTALFEATHLRRQLGAQGYTTWLFPFSSKLYEAAYFSLDEQLWRDAQAFCEANLGANHRDTADSYHNIGANLINRGRYEEAEPYLRTGLELRKAVHGLFHPDVGQSYDMLATNLTYQGRYLRAKRTSCIAIEIFRYTLGPGKIETIDCYNNLASILDLQGRYGEAEPIFRDCLRDTKNTLGHFDQSTGKSYNNLGVNLYRQGKFKEAEWFHRQGLKIREHTLRPNHPSIANSYVNLALCLFNLGNLREAKDYFHRALAIVEQELEPEHPDTRLYRRNLEILEQKLRGEGG